MGHIHVLENDVIDKIAAGEVVERPASVVKELVDNAIDAGATEITISLKDGGRSLIAVTDNGSGMMAEDAQLALTRHATSKISRADDLFEITTRGFRGEALASIAAVSAFTVSTRTRDSADGVRIEVRDGQRTERPFSGAVGTTIVVEDLFASVPVRKKFLKSGQVEWGYCVDVLHHQALSHPEVMFTILHNDKEQWRLPGSGSAGEPALRARAADLFGQQKTAELIYVNTSDRMGSVEGLLSPPGMERSTAKQMYMFVNGRPVKDRTVRYGILRGYHSHLLKGKYPFTILNLMIDPALVDVNVHPAKIELRFQYTSEVQDLLARAIREAIRKGAWAAPDAIASDVPPPSFSLAGEASEAFRYGGSSAKTPAAAHTVSGSAPASRGRFAQTMPSREWFPTSPRSRSSEEVFGQTSSPMGRDVLAHDETLRTAPSSEPIPWADLRFVGDFGRCYLFFSTPGETRLLVVDQHAFHERILYERLCRDETLLQRTQSLLIPESVELAREDLAALKESADALGRRGFKLQFVSETIVEVTQIPAILSGTNLQTLLEDLADPSDAEESVETNADVGRLLLATIACHSAVRAGEELTSDDRIALLAEARDVDFYLNCPHGRRVFRWFDKGQIGRWFDR